MLNEHNVLAQSFRMARDKFRQGEDKNIKLRLIRKRDTDGRRYNLPTASEVAALVIGDIGQEEAERDIIIETRSGHLKRISELHPAYLALQYPLLFPSGEDGFREEILLSSSNSHGKRTTLTMREFFAFRIQDRDGEADTILVSGKLLQQFLVDAYTMTESQRLKWMRKPQKKLRAEVYRGLTEFVFRGETDPSLKGRQIILPSSFTGGARYMIQNYQDAMAICKWAGYPDLFITFTCNPKWPETARATQNKGLKSEDRLDICSRMFKLKLDELIHDLKDKKVFGAVRAGMYYLPISIIKFISFR